jgi:uncharacterized protein (DUF779 family)
MCYPRNEFIVGDNDVLLGHIGGAPVYISASRFEGWKNSDLIIDVVPGQGGMFSLRQRPRAALPNARGYVRQTGPNCNLLRDT